MPHLSSRLQVADFGNYLSKMVDAPSCKWMRHELRAYPINYFVDPVAFAKKYAKKCIAFVGTASPQDGAMNIIYQISPTFHVLARLYHWIEQEQVRAYLMITCAYRDQADYLEFFDENKELRMKGNTEDRQAGFGAVMQSSGLENLLKGFQNKTEKEEEVENPSAEEDKA